MVLEEEECRLLLVVCAILQAIRHRFDTHVFHAPKVVSALFAFETFIIKTFLCCLFVKKGNKH